MPLQDFIGIKYKLDKSENFDEYMKALGVGMVMRKMANNVSAVVELTLKDDVYTLSSTSTFKNTSVTFKLGEEFEEETPDGRKVKSIINLDGDNKLVHRQMGDKETTIVREFSKDQIVMTLTLGSVTSKRTYKAQ